MANNSWTPLGKKIDLSREVQGFLPIELMDPLVQEDVQDGYNLGTTVDGVPVLEGKDPSNQLAFYRLKGGIGATVVQDGNSLVIGATVYAGDTAEIMLLDTFDTNHDGIVNHADLADSAPWSGITGVPTSFPPSAHIHNESDVTGLADDLASKVPQTRIINTSFSLQGGGPLTSDLNLSLIGDVANVGPEMRYGTDESGNLGWYKASEGAMDQAVYDQNYNNIVDLAEALTNNALLTAMIADGAVTGVKIASHTIPGSALLPGAVQVALGYTPLNKAGDVASGPLVVNYSGPVKNANMYQGAHSLLQTTGTGASVPTLGFACLTGGANAGSVAMWYQGKRQDLQLQYDDGSTAHLLSSISAISGAQIQAGSIPASALAGGVAIANLGYVPVNGAGGGYTLSTPLAFQYDAGLGASSWSVAAIRVQTTTGGGNRPQIGFYYPGVACSLYFEPADISMRYIDSGGTVRVLMDSGHGVPGAWLQGGAAVQNIGYQPANRAGDTFSGVVTVATNIGSGWQGGQLFIQDNSSNFAAITFHCPSRAGGMLLMNNQGQLMFLAGSGKVTLLANG
jgi:hypothetical protein